MTAVSHLLLSRWLLCGVGAIGWLCAIWRLAAGEGGAVEATVTAGGWGLGVLPVHVARGGATGERGPRCEGEWEGRGAARGITRASRRRRWGGGSGLW